MKKSSTKPSQLIAEKARYLAKTLTDYARVLESDSLSKEDRERFEADVVKLYETHKRCARKSEAQQIGWLGKYIRDAADGQGSANPVIEDMSRQAPHLAEKLSKASKEIEAVITATANKGGRGKTAATLNGARNALVKKLGLASVSRKSWERSVSECLGTVGKREWSKRAPKPTPAKR